MRYYLSLMAFVMVVVAVSYHTKKPVNWTGKYLVIWDTSKKDGVSIIYTDLEYGYRGKELVTRPWAK
jgi:hypothetical protein